jgi:acetolactate synthase-1/2/3 large subunit
MKEHGVKLSDYVAEFLARQGIRHVFAIAGGASLHLIHSIAKTQGITYICPAHEQAGAMAADAYARVTGNLGAALSTSGPGATNMITGVCCAFYDSVPVIYITGQVATFRLKRDTGVRQMGFQETDVVSIYRPITKYVVLVDDPKRIRYEMEKACYLARSGRPGPVVVDIPDNLQREEINPWELEPFVPPQEVKDPSRLKAQIDQSLRLLESARRPAVILGWGVRLARAEQEARELINHLGFPVLLTWAMMDFLPSSHPLVVGGFGTHGTRFGNLAVQNADLLLTIGSRLDTHETGTPLATFAREARKIVVDIDPNELHKFSAFGADIDVAICADAADFLHEITPRLQEIEKPNVKEWVRRVAHWKERYSTCPPDYYDQEEVNPYVFVKALSKETNAGEVFVVDTGCAIAWMMQAFEFKEGQRLFHDFANTAMGYALPASIGASVALGGKSIICVSGDGALQMNIQELATVMRHNLPIKIFLINNHGYSMIQQTQDQWLDSQYIASSVEGGLAFPNFSKVAEAYGFKVVTIQSNREVPHRIRQVLDYEGAVFCNVEIPSWHRVIPQVKFGRPIEDPEPFLERREFLENMIVKPLDVSLT